jgi:hypothetical protein
VLNDRAERHPCCRWAAAVLVKGSKVETSGSRCLDQEYRWGLLLLLLLLDASEGKLWFCELAVLLRAGLGTCRQTRPFASGTCRRTQAA